MLNDNEVTTFSSPPLFCLQNVAQVSSAGAVGSSVTVQKEIPVTDTLAPVREAALTVDGELVAC